MSAPLLPATMNLLTEEAGSRVGTIRIAGLMGYSDLVAKLGGNPDRLLARCGIDPQIFNDSENIIPLDLANRLLFLAAEETRCPHFGLLLGQRRKLTIINGPVGFLIINSPTVEAALRSLIRYLHLQVEGVTFKLQVQRAEAFFTLTIDQPCIVGEEQLLDLAIADMLMITRMVCGREWLPNEVHTPHRTPVDIAPYRTLCHAPVQFDQKITCLRFPAYWLERPVPNADPDLCRLMQTYVTQIEKKYSGDFPGQIRRVMRTMLPTGKCTADRFAELFSMHRCTLHRRLADHGTTFAAMVDEIRLEIATRNLSETNMSISQLAALLGYRATSTFTRAFSRWKGEAPTEWRARHRS